MTERDFAAELVRRWKEVGRTTGKGRRMANIAARLFAETRAAPTPSETNAPQPSTEATT